MKTTKSYLKLLIPAFLICCPLSLSTTCLAQPYKDLRPYPGPTIPTMSEFPVEGKNVSGEKMVLNPREQRWHWFKTNKSAHFADLYLFDLIWHSPNNLDLEITYESNGKTAILFASSDPGKRITYEGGSKDLPPNTYFHAKVFNRSNNTVAYTLEVRQHRMRYYRTNR